MNSYMTDQKIKTKDLLQKNAKRFFSDIRMRSITKEKYLSEMILSRLDNPIDRISGKKNDWEIPTGRITSFNKVTVGPSRFSVGIDMNFKI